MRKASSHSALQALATSLGLAAGGYLGYAAAQWLRYGRVSQTPPGGEADALLDRFLPVYDVMDHHEVDVAAPAEDTFAATLDLDMNRSTAIRAIFKSREWILRSDPGDPALPKPLLPQLKALGWGVLAEVPGREIVLGAVTQPWSKQVVFRAIPAGEFLAFPEPGFVKIVVTLRADPIDAESSMAVTETRALATDPHARSKFRWYWSAFSPGIVVIRRIALRLVKRDAERAKHFAAP